MDSGDAKPGIGVAESPLQLRGFLFDLKQTSFSDPPPTIGEFSSADVFGRIDHALEQMFALREPLRAALQMGDQAQMVALLKQVVTIRRTVDLDQLRLAHRLALANEFAPSLDQVQAPAAPDDIVAKTIVPRCCAPNIEIGSSRPWARGYSAVHDSER
jgi:hypothetical protein